jgi:hypothetical protein
MEMLNHAVTHGLSYQAQQFCGEERLLRICRDTFGWYLGAWDQGGPLVRDSEEYWDTQAAAQIAFDTHTWIQRMDPTDDLGNGV